MLLRVTTRCIAGFQTLAPAQRLVKGRLRQTNLLAHSLKSLGKGSLSQRLLQIIIRLNIVVDVIRVPKVRTSGEELPMDTNFVSILLHVYVWSLQFLGKGLSNSRYIV